MLSKKSKETFNKAYTFEEPLARAIRSWLKAKNSGDHELQIRCSYCAKFLVEAGGDIHHSEKYLKKPLTPAQRLQNDATRESIEFFKELLKLSEKVKEERLKGEEEKRWGSGRRRREEEEEGGGGGGGGGGERDREEREELTVTQEEREEELMEESKESAEEEEMIPSTKKRRRQKDDRDGDGDTVA
jgi:hypothetical protein